MSLSRTSERLLLAGLLLVGLAVRLPGVDWGLPLVYHPDEPTHVDILLNIIKTGDFNPHWFKYPSFRVYSSLPIVILYFLAGVAGGRFRSVQELVGSRMITLGSGTTDIPGLYLGLRLWMTLFGVLGILYVFKWTKKHFGDRVAWLAAAFLAVSPVHIMVSHWYRPDTILALFCGAAVMAAVGLYRRNDLRSYLLCGALAGLAASVKYNAVVLQFIPIGLAHLLAKRDLFDWRLWVTPLVALAVFLVITPYSLLDLPGFLDGFAFEIHHYYVRGHAGADAVGGFVTGGLWYLRKLLLYDGLWVALAAASVFLVERRRRAEVAILASWPVMVLCLNATARIRTVLALVPLLLVMPVLAAIGLDRVLTLAASLHARFRRNVALGVLACALCVLVPVGQAWRVDALFAQPDARTVASEWLLDNLSPDTRVMMEAYGPVLQTPGARYVFMLSDHSPEWYQAAGVEYIVSSHYWTVFSSPELYPGQVEAYRRLFEFPQVATIEGPLQYLYDPVRELKIHSIPVPSRYELSMGESNAPWLVEGYYAPEQIEGRPIRWTSWRAIVELRLKTGTPYVVRLKGEASRPPDLPPAHSVLSLDDLHLGENTWSNDVQEWTIDLPALEGEDEARLVRLKLETNPWQPSQSGIGTDERTLGVALHRVTVEEAP